MELKKYNKHRNLPSVTPMSPEPCAAGRTRAGFSGGGGGRFWGCFLWAGRRVVRCLYYPSSGFTPPPTPHRFAHEIRSQFV